MTGALRYRQQQATLRNELIARAMGIKPRAMPKILDATAGLGRDSFILAALGFQVTLAERSAILYQLLLDACHRAAKCNELAAIIANMQLININSIDLLTSLPPDHYPDIIYLDPMFPTRQKAASVKKEMIILQDLLGKDEDAQELFEIALTCAQKRLVVKRPRLSTYLTTLQPHFSLTGKSSRFDVYLR